MSRVRKIATALGTFSVALGIGFVMQNGDVLAARFGEGPGAHHPAALDAVAGGPAPVEQAALVTMMVDPAATAEPLLAAILPALATPAAFVPPPAVAVLTDPPVPGLTPVHFAPAPLADTPPGTPLPVAPAASTDCSTTMSATPTDGAMVILALLAPCHPSQPVTLSHAGLTLSYVTDTQGELAVTLPALTGDAAFRAEVGDATAMAMVRVPGVAETRRAVLYWTGDSGLNLHAFANGAAFGDTGHIWQAATGSLAGTTGFWLALGDASAPGGALAQVYTYPAGTGAVDLTVEAEVTTANCGREVTARTLHLAPGADLAQMTLTFQMPGCEAVGEYLILPQMWAESTMARLGG